MLFGLVAVLLIREQKLRNLFLIPDFLLIVTVHSNSFFLLCYKCDAYLRAAEEAASE